MIQWQKYITRRLAVQVAQQWNYGWGAVMQKVFGISVVNTLVFRDAKKTEYYVDSKQHEAYVAGLYRLLRNTKFLQTFHQNVQARLERILKMAQKKFGGDLRELSNQGLLNLYQNFVIPETAQFYVRMWTVFNIAEPLEDVVARQLHRCVGDDAGRVTQYLLALSVPLQPNDVLHERIELLALALRRGKISRVMWEAKLQRHAQTYAHIPMFDFDHRPYTIDHFHQEIRGLGNPRQELAELKRLFRGRQREFNKILSSLKPDRKFGLLLQFLKRNVFLRDYRDMIRQKLNVQLRKFYGEVGRRLGLGVEQVATLTNDEIVQYLRTGKKFPQAVARQREKAFLLIQKGSRVKIFSGPRALAKAKLEIGGQHQQLENRMIKGTVASVGFARGKVKIVYTNKDLPKVKTGDVLVAAMTRQDFVPAMRRASAIVIDEGGITSHAAIVARELKKPCIVGTKIATQVFKDGDRVEVDAERGVVRIIK